MNEIVKASQQLQAFKGTLFKDRVKQLENVFQGATNSTVYSLVGQEQIDHELLSAAFLIKHNSSQINEVIHTLGILLALPNILVEGESVEAMSLAAGNTGKGFDLETTNRIAEFTFIEWQGGPEVIRQNKVFKDFYFLAEAETDKVKELYAIGTSHVRSFLNSQRGLPQILNGNAKLGNSFRAQYRDQFKTVRDYYLTKKDTVKLCDLRECLSVLKKEEAN